MRIEREGAERCCAWRTEGQRDVPTLLERLEGCWDSSATPGQRYHGQGTAFSAGLDLPTPDGHEPLAMRAFIRRLRVVMMRVFEYHPLIAAMNGQPWRRLRAGAPADIRIADRDAKIGLNETQIGIGLPAAVVETLRWQCRARRWRRSRSRAASGRRGSAATRSVQRGGPGAELLPRAMQRPRPSPFPSGLRMGRSRLASPPPRRAARKGAGRDPASRAATARPPDHSCTRPSCSASRGDQSGLERDRRHDEPGTCQRSVSPPLRQADADRVRSGRLRVAVRGDAESAWSASTQPPPRRGRSWPRQRDGSSKTRIITTSKRTDERRIASGSCPVSAAVSPG